MSDQVVDLDNCAREPIHIPGAIQPHGLLFVLREPELRIVQVSENVGLFLGIPADRLLGQDLSGFLTPEQVEKVRFALNSVDPQDHNPVELDLSSRNGMGKLDGFVHRYDSFSYLELESTALSEKARSLDFYNRVPSLTNKLHVAPTLSELLNEAVLGVRETTGFDRVMIYRFAENNEGEVVAEAKAENVEPFLGLWYPASDIPEQARRLYVLNPIRIIVDATYTPVPIVPAINPDTHRPADMTFTGIRSVSAIHCEYLQNMGVTASMSISIIREGRLWGLIACHHFSPAFVPYELRKACTFIGQVLSGEIGRREMMLESSYQAHATVTQAKFLELMANAPQTLLGLVNSSPNLMDLIPSEGAAIVHGEKAHMLGNTPGYEDIMTIVEALQKAGMHSSFITGSLKNHFPLTESMRATASGLIALQIEQDPAAYVLFFRPEVAQTVQWGGNPEKPVLASDDGFRLSPRKSFEIWKEEVKGQARPWSRSEVRAAQELRNLITVVAYAR